MAEANVRLDEIIANPSFRKALHLTGTVVFGYVLLRLTLFILDATHLGTAWLETHQDTGFLIMILVLVSLVLLMDHQQFPFCLQPNFFDVTYRDLALH